MPRTVSIAVQSPYESACCWMHCIFNQELSADSQLAIVSSEVIAPSVDDKTSEIGTITCDTVVEGMDHSMGLVGSETSVSKRVCCHCIMYAYSKYEEVESAWKDEHSVNWEYWVGLYVTTIYYMGVNTVK